MSKPSFSFFISALLIFMLVAPVLGQTRVGKLGVGADVSMQTVLGAGSVSSAAGFGGGFNMSLSLMEGLSLRAKFAVNQLAWKIPSKTITTDVVSLNGYLSGDLMPHSNVNVFPFVGGGLSFYDPKDPTTGLRPSHAVSSFDMQFSTGIGMDYFPTEFWSITLLPEYVMTNSQYYNGPANTGNDTYLRVSLQFRYYFFDQSFITKLLETQRARSKRSK
jgi:hypothetical protein